MRTVFKNHREVCQAWAEQKQEYGKAGNITFRSDTIYSYDWWPMAKIYPNDIALIRDKRYSHSTSQHQNHVRRALYNQGYKLFYVADIDNDNETNIVHYQAKLRKLADRYSNDSITRQYYGIADEAKEYAKVFNVKLPPLFGSEIRQCG